VTVTASRPEPQLHPRDAARAIHARLGIEAPSEIEVDLIAWHYGASVHWRPSGPADARAIIAGSRAILAIAAHARGTPRARFSIAHELGHVLMHADFDGLERLHGSNAPLGPRERAIEFQADAFASELLLPARFARLLCARVPSPTLAHVDELARDFRVSLTVAGRSWPKWTETPCAFFEAVGRGNGAVLRRVVRSATFRGICIERRALREGTLALDLLRARRPVSLPHSRPARRTHTQWWGSSLLDEPVVEECVPVADEVVVGWLTHG
jgi:hypothetical protein